jgi:WD40 repeat protein
MLPSQIAACKFSSDSKYIFIALNDGKIKMFDLDNNALSSDFFNLPADIVQNKIIKFDIDYFNNLISIIDSQNSLFVFDVSNNEILLKTPNVVPSKFNDLGSFVNGLRLIRTNNGVIKI